MPVVTHHQPTPVVQPPVAPLHLPAILAGLLYLGRTAGPTTALRPFSAGYGRLNVPSAQLVSKFSTVIALVSSQAGGTLLRASLRSWHSDLVHHLQPYGNFQDMGRTHQKSQGQPITLSQQMDGASLTLPAIGAILSPFWAGTKLPSRKAWLQSSFSWAARALKNFNQIPSHTPWCCHSWRRRWQVEEAPYRLGRSRHLAPERSTQRMPLMVRRSSALGRPRFLASG